MCFSIQKTMNLPPNWLHNLRNLQTAAALITGLIDQNPEPRIKAALELKLQILEEKLAQHRASVDVNSPQ